MSKKLSAPFRYDIVGSFLRPEILKKARAEFLEGKITKTELTKTEDAEIIKLIEKQKELGLKAVTDGEFRRKWWHLDFIANLEGITTFEFETSGFGGKMVKADGSYVSGKLAYNKNHPFIDHFLFTKKCAGDDAVAKQTIPGPGMIYLSSYIVSEKYKKNPVYASDDDFILDLVKTYQDAIQSFYDAGCRYLQLDDTSWGALFSEKSRESIESFGYNPDELIDRFHEITEKSLAKKPDDMVISHHFCRGNFMSAWLYEGTYDKIAKALLSIEEIDGFFWEYDDSRSGDFTPLSNLKNQKIVLGIITTKTAQLEDKNELLEKVKEAEKYVSKDQICISPQCGFASTEHGNNITEDDQWNKIKLLVDFTNENFS